MMWVLAFVIGVAGLYWGRPVRFDATVRRRYVTVDNTHIARVLRVGR